MDHSSQFKRSEIVRYDNALNAELSKIEFQKFRPVEQNLFFAICAKMKNRHEETVTLTFRELKELGRYDTGQSKAELFEDLDSMLDKLQEIKVKIDDGETRKTHTLFPVHSLSRANETAEIKIGAPFVYLLNDFDNGGWTRYELSHFTQLESRYSKTMFRLLKRWRMKGVFTIDISRFRVELGVPESYLMKDINRRILQPIEKELTPMFENFKVTRHKTGRKVTSLTFSFKKEKADREEVDLFVNKGTGRKTIRETIPESFLVPGTETPLSPEQSLELDLRIARTQAARKSKKE